MNVAYNMDCMEYMRTLPDNAFDLAVVDPPYGIDVANMNMGAGNSPRCSKLKNRLWNKANWDKQRPGKEYFSELFRVSKNQIIWGGNYFDLPPCKCFLIWDKGEGMYGRSFAECEQAGRLSKIRQEFLSTLRLIKCVYTRHKNQWRCIGGFIAATQNQAIKSWIPTSVAAPAV